MAKKNSEPQTMPEPQTPAAVQALLRPLENVRAELEKQLTLGENEISIIKLVDLLVEFGYISRASDIHIEPTAKKVVVRLRIDGILHDSFAFDSMHQSEVISRIKVLSGLKIDIHQIPQDGRFKAKVPGVGEIDVRVSIAPTYYGENAVLRILAEAAHVFALEDLGFTEEQLAIVNKAIKRPHGMLLANGPTGSGKTTTLYAMTKKISSREISIITIEDPIEYSIEGFTQMPVNVQAGLTFANGLRSILRQDPNVIMVGEIRDSETASIAVNAALTGHMVFSTLHTNDAATTFPRLIDMGVPPFLVASTVNIAIAQRLVRIACPKCKKERALTAAEIKNLSSILKEVTIDKIYTVGKGCEVCNGTGYKSRIAVHEVLEVDDEIRHLITNRASASEIKQSAVKRGMKTMIMDGIAKAQEGITTLEEILRIVYE